MAFVIAEPCIGTKDTACVDACPVDCIHPKKNTTYDDGRPTFDSVPQLYIDPVECIDCGACVPVCPVSAIFALDDLPEKWKQYTELNASYVQGGKFTSEEHVQAQRSEVGAAPHVYTVIVAQRVLPGGERECPKDFRSHLSGGQYACLCAVL
jgi:NAD-dependent dihydropyrimidine dehydrogenase PreA subunit